MGWYLFFFFFDHFPRRFGLCCIFTLCTLSVYNRHSVKKVATECYLSLSYTLRQYILHQAKCELGIAIFELLKVRPTCSDLNP